MTATLFAGRSVAASTVAAGVCDQCGQVSASDQDGARTATCQCGALVKLAKVRGTYSNAHNCDDQCLYARRGDCVCACGGANHQRGYLVATLVPERVKVRNARDHAAKVQRRQAKAEAEAQAIRDQLADDIRTMTIAHPLAVLWIRAAAAQTDAELGAHFGSFAQSLRDQLTRKGWLSPRQVEAAERNMTKDARKAEERATQPEASPAPSGKVTVTGKVLTTRSEPSAFAYGKTDYRMLVLDDRGFKCWGTIPGSLHTDADGMIVYGWLDELKGKRVSFNASLEPSADDPCFAYFKRPTKARRLDG